MFDKPKGGTELMYDELMRRLPDNYKEQFSIFNYPYQADTSKQTIYWNQLSYDQDAVQFLKDPQSIEQIDHFVFVSHWQAEMFRKIYNVPGFKTHVLKNASLGVEPREVGPRKKVRLCFTSTPWRGLDILLDAWELIKPNNCELHIFSSCKIYGQEFGKNDVNYEHLYERCTTLPGVVYRGNIPNFELRKELPTFDILAYPNTFEETSCIAVIEALSAGLRVVTSNLGALPETTEGWARMYPYLMDPSLHAQKFASILSEEIENIRGGKLNHHLRQQVDLYNTRWTWDYRIKEWLQFLDSLSFTTLNPLNDQVYLEVYTQNEYQIDNLFPEDIVIDLGSHIGTFSKLCYDKGSRNIFCYEADLNNFNICSRNLYPYNIKVFNTAVWRSDKESQILRVGNSPIDNRSSMRTILENGDQPITTTKLDDILSQFNTVKLLKIDIEGSEYPVLYTSTQLNKVQEIVGEYHEFLDTKDISINGYKQNKKGLYDFLTNQGFKITLFQEHVSYVPGYKTGTFKAIKNI